MAKKDASAYRTISEAASETGLPAHVLRFWESKFSQLRPVKRAGGRRLYRPQDVTLILGLKHLLYEEGYTIKGAQKYLKDHGVSHLTDVITGAADAAPSTAPAAPAPVDQIAEDAPLFAHASGQDASIAPGETDPERAARLNAVFDRLKHARATLNAARQSG
jgi:DNA-binding transcriptional MerR regulator